MIFSKVFKSNPIRTFELVLNSGGNNNSIAFGAGSVINGSIKLFLDKPISLKSIRVLFKCEEWNKKKGPSSILFSVESCIWSQQEPLIETETGSHIYLFAIQLPSSVNFPPTISDAYLGHRIEYSLQGFIDLEDNTIKSTLTVPLTYLPLVSFEDHSMNFNNRREKTIKIEKGNEYIQITAKLTKPSSCPGEMCSVKLFTHNLSSYNINQIQILLLSTATSLHSPNSSSLHYPDLPTPSGPSYHHKQRQILTESFYVSIPKNTREIITVCPFKVPSFCVPTTQCHFGKYIDISYELVIIFPTMGHSAVNHNLVDIGGSTNNILINPQAIRLPLIVTTIPYSSTLPPKLQIPFADENNTDVPTFIKSNESPLPSPGGAWSPGSPIIVDDEILPDDLLALPPSLHPEDASGGYLMVPPINNTNNNSLRRSISIHSTGSY